MKYLKLSNIPVLVLVVFLSIFQFGDENVRAVTNNVKVNNEGSTNKKSIYNEDRIHRQVIEKKNNDYENNQKREENESRLEDEIKKYLGENINNVGISYYDIKSKSRVNINEDKVFLAGSTCKVQLNMVLADMLENGQIDENEQLNYKSSDYEEGTGILQGTDMSKPYKITLLSEYSITHSDNIATNMIIDKIGYDNFRNLVDKKLGQATDHSKNYITAAEETNLLTQLYKNKENNPYYTDLILYMKETDFHDRLDKYVSRNIVAHKIGDYSDYVNDVGIVYSDCPYIISIYTEGIPNASEVIANISKIIYNYQSTLK